MIACLSVWGCHVYDDSLVGTHSLSSTLEDGGPDETRRADASMAMSKPMDAGQSEAGAANGLGTCAPGGECFWWSSDGDCRSARAPSSDERVTVEADGPSLGDIYLGWTQITLSADGAAAMSPPASSFGLDLDGVCTNSTTCDTKNAVSCHSSSAQIPYDGDHCRDNSFATLVAFMGQIPQMSMSYGFSQDQFNCGLRRGTYNIIMRIKGYNGQPNDSSVRVDWYTSSGLEKLPDWSCNDSDTAMTFSQLPIWRASATWHIDQQDLTGDITQAGHLPDSHSNDANAYVRQGYLVSQLPAHTTLRLAGDGKPFRGFDLPVDSGVWMGQLVQGQDTTWSVKDGLVAGRIRSTDVMPSLQSLGFCRNMGLDTIYELVSNVADENADLLTNGQVDPNADCDALSFGIKFEAAQVTPGGADPIPPVISCCPPGMSLDQCQAQCGDGKVSQGEQCDTAIPAGQQGACPTSCNKPCMTGAIKGSGCAAQCEYQPITTFKPGDGCCPPGADPTTDSDCKTKCGNNILEAGETCDPSSSCQACPSGNACVIASPTGSAQTCTADCSYTEISSCKSGDNCCPKNCTHANDTDCSDTCHNGKLDPQEACEDGTSTPCPTDCNDNNPCTVDVLTGSADTCSARCTHEPILKPMGGDACCQKGANANTDSDCKPVCGNGVVESGEECDSGMSTGTVQCTSDCKKVDQTALCMSRLGTNDDCSKCVCSSCLDQALQCVAEGSASDQKACRDVAVCIQKANCKGADCYCGQDYTGLCLTPAGPCRAEISAASGGATFPPTVAARSTDPNYPFSRAATLGECGYSACAAPCGIGN